VFPTVKREQDISPLNQFILMLAKLRQDVDYLPLSKMCGVSVFTAENVFIMTVNFIIKFLFLSVV